MKPVTDTVNITTVINTHRIPARDAICYYQKRKEWKNPIKEKTQRKAKKIGPTKHREAYLKTSTKSYIETFPKMIPVFCQENNVAK